MSSLRPPSFRTKTFFSPFSRVQKRAPFTRSLPDRLSPSASTQKPLVYVGSMQSLQRPSNVPGERPSVVHVATLKPQTTYATGWAYVKAHKVAILVTAACLTALVGTCIGLTFVTGPVTLVGLALLPSLGVAVWQWWLGRHYEQTVLRVVDQASAAGHMQVADPLPPLPETSGGA